MNVLYIWYFCLEIKFRLCQVERSKVNLFLGRKALSVLHVSCQTATKSDPSHLIAPWACPHSHRVTVTPLLAIYQSRPHFTPQAPAAAPPSSSPALRATVASSPDSPHSAAAPVRAASSSCWGGAPRQPCTPSHLALSRVLWFSTLFFAGSAEETPSKFH